MEIRMAKDRNERLYEACRKGSLQKVKKLLAPHQFSPFGWLRRNREHETISPINISLAMMSASENGYTDIVEFLISKGADVNFTGLAGETPLSLSSKNGHKDVIELLISTGADIHARDSSYPILCITLNSGQRDIAKLLIEKGADLNAIGYPHRNIHTPLCIAVQRGYKNIVELLIAKGADVNKPNHRNMTPLEIASSNGHKDIEKLLLSKGARTNGRQLKLACQKCGQVYSVGVDAISITTEELTGMFGGVVGRMPPALMIGLANSDTSKDVIEATYDIVLRVGVEWGWICSKCEQKNSWAIQ
jgi:ankyrin repeat protein